MSKFAVFIISHERADRVETVSTLALGGYTGDVYIVVDEGDRDLPKYKKRFGSKLCIFNKSSCIENTDRIIQKRLSASAVYARNEVERLAKELNLDAFAMLDDDITKLRFRWPDGDILRSKDVSYGLDSIFAYYTEFIISSNITDVAFATVMLYCGGLKETLGRLSSCRQCYACHIRNVSKPVNWISVVNEDLITELVQGKIGDIFLTLPFVLFESPPINSLPGGVKEVYNATNDFTRSFLATMATPSNCMPIWSHDKIVISYKKKYSFPMIIGGKYKK